MEFWEVMERELARRLKGLLTPGSGNKSIKGDVHCDLFVVEAKWRAFTYNDEHYLTLEESWLNKITKEAARYGKEPLLAICIANVATYYLMRREYWEESDGRLDYIKPRVLECPRKQRRLYAKEDFAYTIFRFSEAGQWISLPEGDLFFLVELARRSLGQEDPCQKKPRPPRPPWRRPEKTPAQLEREDAAKERLRELRKELYRRRKQQRSAQETY